MRAIPLRFAALVTSALLLLSCGKETETVQTEDPAAYLPLQPGKFITYRLDSTVFTSFGRKEERHAYQEKHVVDAAIKDNNERPSYRVIRYLRDSTGNGTWLPAGTYMITPTPAGMEVVENNLRTLRLIRPLRAQTTWKGNRYLPAEPYAGGYNFSNDDNMSEWDFVVDRVDETVLVNGKDIPGVLTVISANESFNVPVTDASAYAARTWAVDQYAKGIGLVFQELVLWEYQPNTGGTGGPYKVGFGVKRTMIDHN